MDLDKPKIDWNDIKMSLIDQSTPELPGMILD